jgi:hypothetical protein
MSAEVDFIAIVSGDSDKDYGKDHDKDYDKDYDRRISTFEHGVFRQTPLGVACL